MDIHKGTIKLQPDNIYDDKWVIAFADAKETLPLHPCDIEEIKKLNEKFDNIEARILANPEVEFTIVSAVIHDHDVSMLKHFARLYYWPEVSKTTEEVTTKLWDASELYDLLEEYRGYAYGNGLSAAKLNEWWDKNIVK
jgi:hypothetical protein